MKKYMFALIALTSVLVSSIHANECFDEGLYVGGFVGVNFLDIGKGSGIKPGFIAGASLGYKFENSIRIEGEFAYRRNTFKRHYHSWHSYSSYMKGSCETYAVMGNIYYDFDLDCDFTPYIGQGIGYAHNRTKVHTNRRSRNENVFAYQAMVGVNYKICEKTYAGLEYKFFAPGKHAYDHVIAATMKRSF